MNCINCFHYAPLAKTEYINVDDLKNVFLRLSELTGSEVQSLYLLGGEPLLHPNIEEIIEISRSCFHYGRIVVVTNGLLISQMRDGFWEKCQTIM